MVNEQAGQALTYAGLLLVASGFLHLGVYFFTAARGRVK